MYEEYSGIQLTWEMGQLQCVSFHRRFETTVSEVNHKLPFFQTVMVTVTCSIKILRLPHIFMISAAVITCHVVDFIIIMVSVIQRQQVKCVIVYEHGD